MGYGCRLDFAVCSQLIRRICLISDFCPSGYDFTIPSSRLYLMIQTLGVALRFVGNYIPGGLSPQTGGMPVILQKAPGASISQGQCIYFSRPEKHPFSDRKFTQFFLKNHCILWFYPPFLSKNRKCHLNYRSLMRHCGGIDANPEILSLLLHLYQPHLIQDFLSAYITAHTPMTPSALYNILVTYPLALPKDHVIHGEGHHPFTQQFIQSLLYFPESQVWNHTKRIARK